MPDPTKRDFPLPTMPTGNRPGVFSVDTSGWHIDNSVPPGDYPAVLLEVEESVSSNGNRMLIWTFALVGGKYAGREFRTYTVLTENSAWKLRQVLRATGLGDIGQRIDFDYNKYVNTLVILTLEDDFYKGDKRSTVAKVSPPDSGAGTKWTPQGGLFPAPVLPPAPADDDEVPFGSDSSVSYEQQLPLPNAKGGDF